MARDPLGTVASAAQMYDMATNPQSGFVNTAPLIAGNRRGHVYLLGLGEVGRRFHESAVLVATQSHRRARANATSDLG